LPSAKRTGDPRKDTIDLAELLTDVGGEGVWRAAPRTLGRRCRTNAAQRAAASKRQRRGARDLGEVGSGDRANRGRRWPGRDLRSGDGRLAKGGFVLEAPWLTPDKRSPASDGATGMRSSSRLRQQTQVAGAMAAASSSFVCPARSRTSARAAQSEIGQRRVLAADRRARSSSRAGRQRVGVRNIGRDDRGRGRRQVTRSSN